MVPSGEKTGAKERSISIQSYFDKLVLYSVACSNSHACMLVSLNTGKNQKYYKIRPKTFKYLYKKWLLYSK